mmetsp:Transcript_17718/g.35618  ORF Transcript_17718/g.35618 Transcript_17718/m.35618 type:complete len:82 (-) Transcript_17718:27-272(-)
METVRDAVFEKLGLHTATLDENYSPDDKLLKDQSSQFLNPEKWDKCKDCCTPVPKGERDCPVCKPASLIPISRTQPVSFWL